MTSPLVFLRAIRARTQHTITVNVLGRALGHIEANETLSVTLGIGHAAW